MDEERTALVEAIEQSRSGKVRWRCPASLRSEVVDFAEKRRASGRSWASIAGELLVSEASLMRWCQKAGGSFRRVEVKSSSSRDGGLRLVTPRGYVVEGLSVASAAELLSRL